MKRIIRVHEYRHDEGQTCLCATACGNVVTLWDEIPRSEVVRMKEYESNAPCSITSRGVTYALPKRIDLAVAKPTVLSNDDGPRCA